MNRYKNINFENAKKSFTKSGDLYCGGFSEYSPAYVMTNEDLRPIIKLRDLKNQSVLTACGSGDHPIFYKSFGAKIVDTFDISFCAGAVMDIKTTAIKKFNHAEYINVIFELHKSRNFSKTETFSKLKNKLSKNTTSFIENMDGYNIFSSGMCPINYENLLPTPDEYLLIQKNIKNTFNFIWSDISDLHHTLKSNYDIMNLSNIFQYIPDAKKTTDILNGLSKNLSNNGMIIAQTACFFNNHEMEKFETVRAAISAWGKMGMYNSKTQQAIIIQKIK